MTQDFGICSHDFILLESVKKEVIEEEQIWVELRWTMQLACTLCGEFKETEVRLPDSIRLIGQV